MGFKEGTTLTADVTQLRSDKFADEAAIDLAERADEPKEQTDS
jgi:hypothetical protein